MDMVAIQPGVMGKMRYMHKDELKYIPLFGLYFWQVGLFGSLLYICDVMNVICHVMYVICDVIFVICDVMHVIIWEQLM